MTRAADGGTSPRRATARADGEDADARLVDLVRQLGRIVSELALSEVEVAHGDRRVRVQRTLPTPLRMPAPAEPEHPASTPALLPAAASADITSSALVTVEAPMVGTFYRASSPSADPYVREGDLVKHGQILCIIEAMKLMNEIESKVSGRVVKILVENGQPVEYDQPLFLIDPR